MNMGGPPLKKDEIGALDSLKRGPVKQSALDEGMRQNLSSKGLVQEKLGSVQLTARGKMTLQRRGSVKRGRGSS
jgi:hypothetical protein